MAEKQATLWLKVKSTGEEAVGNLKKGLEGIIDSALGWASAALSLSAIIVKSIAEYKEKESAIKELSTAMVNNGIYTGELKDAYLAQAEALSKLTLFEDDQIIKAQAVVQQQIGQREVTQELTQAILDFAQAQGMDLASAANVVGKSIGGTTNALSRYGIEIANGTTKSERMQQAIDGLSNKFGGQAQAATEGLGSLNKFQMALNDLFETIGSRLAPMIGIFVKRWTDFITTSEMVKSGIDILEFGFRSLLNTVSIVSNVIGTAWNLVMNAIGTGAAIVGELMAGNFKKAGNMVVDYMERQKEMVVGGVKTTYDEILKNDQAYTEAKNQELLKREQNELDSMQRSKDAAAIKAAEDEVIRLEGQIKELELQQQMVVDEDKFRMTQIQASIKFQDDLLKTATDARAKAAILQTKANLEEQLLEEKKNELKKQQQKDTLSTIAGMQNSSNKTLAAIGKAAALTQIAIDTPMAISKAMAAFPPPFNFIAAGAVGAAMAAQAAQVAGVQLAEGGIVMPRAGGVQATIAEAGQAEAVIPLDRMGDFGMGGGTNISIVVNGGLMGDQSSAREFAVAIDRELFKLRKNNESVSFEGIVI